MRSSVRKLVGVVVLVVIIGGFAATIAAAQDVALKSPANGATVRGTVEITATKPSPADGWVAFKILKHGESGDFTAAISSPFKYAWDTLALDDKGARIYPDGSYDISIEAFDPSAQSLGTANITVTVQNAAGGGEAVTLRPGYRRHQDLRFELDGTQTLKGSEKAAEMIQDGKLAADVYTQARTGAHWSQEVLAPSVTGEAILDTRLKSGYYVIPKYAPGKHKVVADRRIEFENGEVVILSPKPTKGTEKVSEGVYKIGPVEEFEVTGGEPEKLEPKKDIYRFSVKSPTYIEKTLHKDVPKFAWAMIYTPLPSRAVSIGDTWEGETPVMPVIEADAPVKVNATHRLDGFDTVNGEKCARIVSRINGDAKVSVKLLRWTVDIKPGEGEGDNPPYSVKITQFYTQPIESKVHFAGDRTSLFAIDGGYFVQIRDVLKDTIEVDVSQLGSAGGGMGAMGGGMPGMPGMGGMGGGMPGMPGMGGMGGMPGMPGMPGMGGMGGMPGMPGMGGEPGMGGGPSGMPGMGGMPAMGGMGGPGGMPDMGGPGGMPGMGGMGGTAKKEYVPVDADVVISITREH